MKYLIRGILKYFLAAAAAAALVYGILDGQMQDVLQKAIRICLECIGIG